MDEADVRACRKGDRNAFARLIENHRQSMYRVALAILQNDSDAADAIQEAIIKAYLNIKRLKRPEMFKTWLIRILINECNYILRQRKKIVPMDAGVPAGQERDYADCDTRLVVRKALQALEEELRMVVVLYYYEDLAVKDIAAVLEIPEGTVKSRLARARSLLAEAMNGQMEGEVTADYGRP